ncbi:MAG: hypothetical protein A4S09_14945 [Proteobacteria bacterium SG_bin7]|nr:MAG: hypothetical protein A4S09_14945 [Proteobacteria bacterium SG_bin7]
MFVISKSIKLLALGYTLGFSLVSPALGGETSQIVKTECPDLSGYYFSVTPIVRLGGTTIAQKVVNGHSEFTFTERNSEGKAEAQHDIFIADGATHNYFSYGRYAAACKDGALIVQLSYMIPESDHFAASFDGTKTYSTYLQNGIRYLSVEVNGSTKIASAPTATPVIGKYSARKIKN